MTRYIDADNIQFITVPIAPLSKRDQVHYEKVVFKRGIDNEPTVDVAPVRHGKWIPNEIMVHNYYAITGFKCSVCGEGSLTDCGHFITIKTNFCPNCGARMDQE